MKHKLTRIKTKGFLPRCKKEMSNNDQLVFYWVNVECKDSLVHPSARKSNFKKRVLNNNPRDYSEKK